MATTVRGAEQMGKRISISVKRQLTIPLQYFEELGFGSEAYCEVVDNKLVIRPVKNEASGEFDEYILADLISQGLSGNELLEAFKAERKKIRPAVEKMLAEASEMVKSGKGFYTLDELFGPEED